jgi:hypothetical protein
MGMCGSRFTTTAATGEADTIDGTLSDSDDLYGLSTIEPIVELSDDDPAVLEGMQRLEVMRATEHEIREI